ncbi:MAG: class I SAM-dependent methyltransferase [Vicinamibacterales bacterium]|nr:class I SAM-dependent methyltransferase [Vicinamibacterales bacterium]
MRCTLCGADQPQELCRVPEDRYLKALDIVPSISVKVMCMRCGHIYGDPQLDNGEIDRLYRHLYRSSALGYTGEAAASAGLRWKQAKSQRDYAWLTRRRPRTASGTALEIGCAEGLFLSRLATEGWRVVGIEPTLEYAAHARDTFDLEVLETPFEEVDFAGRRFDLVGALAVLEHAKDPVDFLSRIRTVLHPQGTVFVTVPNVLDLGDFSDDRLSSPHISLFTPDTLRRTFQRAGLVIYEMGPLGDLLAAVGQPAAGTAMARLETEVPSARRVRRAIAGARARARARRGRAKLRSAARLSLARVIGEDRTARLAARLRLRDADLGSFPRGQP